MRESVADHCSARYERPNQLWVCGLASEGEPCPVGPTARGHCPALAECKPLRDGARWHCNRSTLRGGPCDAGPTPEGDCPRVRVCRPVRSLRAMRGRFVTAVALLVTGGMSVLLSGAWRNEFIAPGPLARPHAQLFNSEGRNAKCSTCHAAADDGALNWASGLIAMHNGPTQSQLCLKCHGETIWPQFALVAHTVSPEVLQQLTARAGAPRRRLTDAIQGAFSPGEQVACSACHREHHGAEANLTAIDNAACQACHQQRYESFAADHPDFGVWPYERRTRIAFNHASHRSKHFAEKAQTFDCRKCHTPDATRTVQLTASYEAACAECHDEKIAMSLARGVPIFLVPSLDVDVLRAAGQPIGAWPEKASGDFDGRLPPAMKLLLAADAPAASALATLGDEFDFFDVDVQDAEQLAACADLANAIKSLFADVSARGPAAVKERLAKVLGHEVPDRILAALVAGMPADVVRGPTMDWLQTQGKERESADWPAVMTLSPASYSKLHASHAYAPAGTWSRDDATLSIRYRPAGHADPVLTGWLDVLASAGPTGKPNELANEVFEDVASPTAAGLCASCHSVERTAGGKTEINWRASHAKDAPRFTKFSHSPHLALPQLADCTACHAVDESANQAATHTGVDANRFVSDFSPITKRLCAECHTASAAGDRCQSCHNYHVKLQ